MGRMTLLGAGAATAAAASTNTHSLTLAKASSQYAHAADSGPLSFTGSFTLELWIKVTSLPGSGVGCPIIFKGDYNTDNSYQLMYLNDGGTPKLHGRIFATAGNTDFADSKLTYTLTTGTWFHVAMVCVPTNGTSTKFEWFINGASQGNGTSSLTGTVASVYNNGKTFRIGQSDPVVGVTDYYLDAKVDDIRAWSDARTSGEISANYNVELVGNEANLEGYWKVNNSTTDETANANNLTLSGSPSYSTDIPF